MSRDLYLQLDRIEGGVSVLLNDHTTNILIGFYEEEILSKDGILHHLQENTKVRQFFASLTAGDEEEEEDSEDEAQEEEQEFASQPFQ